LPAGISFDDRFDRSGHPGLASAMPRSRSRRTGRRDDRIRVRRVSTAPSQTAAVESLGAHGPEGFRPSVVGGRPRPGGGPPDSRALAARSRAVTRVLGLRCMGTAAAPRSRRSNGEVRDRASQTCPQSIGGGAARLGHVSRSVERTRPHRRLFEHRRGSPAD
jgi:hypothetical protein